MYVRERLYIGGAWVSARSGRIIPVIDPATEAQIGHVPEGDERDIDDAAHAARRVLGKWSGLAPERRAEYLRSICENLAARSEELIHLVSVDVGMPRRMAARMQVSLPIAILGQYAELAGRFEFEQRVGNSLVIRDPLGVVGCITPWNYPLFQIATKLGPALAAGCTVVLKPSEVAPLVTFVLAEAVEAAGVPPGVVNLVTGFGQVAGESLVTHPEVDAISFTGSTRAGRRIAELAGRLVRPVGLELGGKSASIILDDADLETAVRATVNSCFLNSGQTCIALTRMLVPQSRYEEAARLAVAAAERLTVGDPRDERTKLGPLVSAVQRDRVREFIRQGVASGAELLTGGSEAPPGLEKGFYVQPTVFGRVRPDSAIAQREIFGPVLAVMTYRDEDEAVDIANGTPYGLSGGVWSASDARATEVARRLRTGQVDINGGAFNLSAPIGGYKQSGYGRELGVYGLESFTQYKSLQFRA